ncbi:MFS transporter [Luteimicrobium subarcticum]|uniref:Putative MFS family arabinose efflux permease n=1 Tax=Luteimicrobium subarcticum TaxID=620910 RepID=A0A2M8W408_9MICO|nr:MFS transporter [Luteimicrobium subarcticum]PJI85663.1 putative MFS family arabinose efflux permease [Luteimicrobium subarcticum]
MRSTTSETDSGPDGLKEITTDVPARLDRLPWARWHWTVIVGLGVVWILDGLEVTIVGNLSDALKSSDTGLGLSSSQIGMAGAVYVTGSCVGALLFGQLTDRFGRKKLFIITLLTYLLGTVLTAFSMNPAYYFAVRFVTGMGIGGEYAAVNSAVDELVPARYRGRVDITINGSYWLGAAGGALVTIPLLNPDLVPAGLGWRVCFALGAVLGLAILFVRRNVPESPRWLFIHGREKESERIVSEIEETVERESGEKLPAPEGTITVRQRHTIGLGRIARTVFKDYPRRTILCLGLFVGQAFLYNAFFFTFGDTLQTFLGVDQTGAYIALFAVSNFAGALLLGPLFDKVGRVRMISATYIVSGVLLAVAGVRLDSLTAVSLTAFGMAIFFVASAGASSAYLTASEVFPMETRALCIAFFYAIGTAVGGITGPLLFGRLIDSASAAKDIGGIAVGYYIGAALMVGGGVLAMFLGVNAERKSLEDIATPLTAEDADASSRNADD